MKSVEKILKLEREKSNYVIYNEGYKKYVEINGIKQATCPQALEVRDNNARYYIIEKEHEFVDDFCVFNKDNWITLDIKLLLNNKLKQKIIDFLSRGYNYVTFIMLKDSKDKDTIIGLFSDIVIDEESQNGINNSKLDFYKIRVNLK